MANPLLEPAYVKRATDMFLRGAAAAAQAHSPEPTKILEKVASQATKLRDQAERAVLGTILTIESLAGPSA